MEARMDAGAEVRHESTESVHKTHGPASLWAGVLGAPLLWALHLQVGYMMVPWVCHQGRHWLLHAVTGVFLLAMLACLAWSWHDWRRVGGGVPSSRDGSPVARSRFFGLVGIASSALFAWLTLSQGVAAFFIHPCTH